MTFGSDWNCINRISRIESESKLRSKINFEVNLKAGVEVLSERQCADIDQISCVRGIII